MIHIDGKAGKVLVLYDDKVKISTIKTIGENESIKIPLIDIERVELIDPNEQTLGKITLFTKGESYFVDFSNKYIGAAQQIKTYIDSRYYTGAPGKQPDLKEPQAKKPQHHDAFADAFWFVVCGICIVVGFFNMIDANFGGHDFVGGDAYNMQMTLTVATNWFILALIMAVIGSTKLICKYLKQLNNKSRSDEYDSH